MDFDTLGEIIATRRLYFVDEGNVRRTVSVFIGKPQPSPDSRAYQCPFQIIGIGSQKTSLANGNDSIEALQSAMILIGANLNNLNDELGGRLNWEGAAKGDLGFTVVSCKNQATLQSLTHANGLQDHAFGGAPGPKKKSN